MFNINYIFNIGRKPDRQTDRGTDGQTEGRIMKSFQKLLPKFSCKVPLGSKTNICT